jgi:hypothetical protein
MVEDEDSAGQAGAEPAGDPGWRKRLAGAERLKTAARAGEVSGDPVKQFFYEAVRARDRWTEQPRESLQDYLMAVANFVERLDPDGALDIVYPLHAAAAALEDLKRGVTASWLRAASTGGTAASTKGMMLVRAFVAAGVDLYVAHGLSVDLASKEIAAALRGLDLPVGKNSPGVTAGTVCGWHKRSKREGDKGPSEEERQLKTEIMAGVLKEIPPSELPKLLKKLIKGRLTGPAIARGE